MASHPIKENAPTLLDVLDVPRRGSEDSSEPISRTATRNEITESKPLLAPFAPQNPRGPFARLASSTPRSQSLVNIHSAVSNSASKAAYRLHEADQNRSFFPLVIGNTTSPPKSPPLRSQSAEKEVPQLKRQEIAEGRDALPPSMSAGLKSANVNQTITRLKESLSGDVVVKLDQSESALEFQLASLGNSLKQLSTLRQELDQIITHCIETTDGSIQDGNTHLERVQALREEFATVDKLEERMRAAKQKVEECKQKLHSANQRITLKENDFLLRKTRIMYAKRGTVAALVLLVVLITLLRVYFRKHSSRDLDSILECLSNLQECTHLN
uniref:ARAD1B20262p n=1 Tax=Blastobotrys adeninivorans TaxID=409370 RepID=A0A060TD08_BLAAD